MENKIKFGRRQYKNPTPKKVSDCIAVFTVVAGIVATWVNTVSFIPSGLSMIISSILTLLISIANGVKPFFGVKTSQTNVPIEDVGEMETTKDNSTNVTKSDKNE